MGEVMSSASYKKVARKRRSGTRQRILEVAKKLFAKKGVHGTTIDEITRRARISKGSFYTYYKGKKQLVLEIIASLSREVIPQASWKEIAEKKEFWSRFETRLRIFLEHYNFFFGLLVLTMDAFDSESSSLSSKAKEAYRLLFEPVMRDLRRGKEQGAIRRDVDDTVLVHAMFGIGIGLGNLLLLKDTGKSPAQLASEVRCILQSGLSYRNENREATIPNLQSGD